MAFQRSYSKVWWGSDDNQFYGSNTSSAFSSQHLMPNSSVGGVVSLTSGGLYSTYLTQPNNTTATQSQNQQAQPQQFGGPAYHSLDLHQYKCYGNLSRIQEVENEQDISRLSWEKHSPGSLRSQDSGFSDNEEFHSTRSLSARSSKNSSPSSKSLASTKTDVGSPSSSTRSVATPPTVVRKTGKSEFYTPLVNVSRRISFTSSPSAKRQSKDNAADSTDEGPTLLEKLDGINLDTECSPSSSQSSSIGSSSSGSSTPTTSPTVRGHNPRVKKMKKIQRTQTKPLTQPKNLIKTRADSAEEENDDSEVEQLTNKQAAAAAPTPEYNNETVYLGMPPCSTPPPPYNNETVVLGGPLEDSLNKTIKLDDHGISPLRLHARFSGNTSTPKNMKLSEHAKTTLPAHMLLAYNLYDNSLLNGHTEDIQSWLDDMRMSYDHEVMSTLQTKSIAQEAFKNLKITTNTVVKLIRQLQQKALHMQANFEKVDKMLTGAENCSLHEALTGSLGLVDHVSEFILILERRSVFFADSRMERKRYEEHLDQIRIVNKDTRYSLENQHYINIESLLEDLLVLKRNLLIAVRQVYAKLVGILVESIETGKCDMMLKANINMIVTLMNIEYDGFASLTDAFVQTEAVRALLMVCLDHKQASLRAQSLRALSTICSAPEPIEQLGSCGGIEVIRDILQVPRESLAKKSTDLKRSDMERREAVSLLTQITAAWHGPEHRVHGIHACVETLVEGLTQLLIFTECSQTLLLCAAALNNLSRMEMTSHYSIMSHETISKIMQTIECREQGISIFLYEQIAAMLYNMSLNKKCHSHLANGNTINFITYIYQTEFYKTYESRGESESKKRCIKTILHSLIRLVQDSVLGMELLEQQKHMPSALFFRLNATNTTPDMHQQQLPLDESHSRDISLLARQLLLAQNQENGAAAETDNEVEMERIRKYKLQLQRQESYV